MGEYGYMSTADTAAALAAAQLRADRAAASSTATTSQYARRTARALAQAQAAHAANTPEEPTMPTTLTWKRDQPGRQVSTCGRYAVEVDGFERGYVGTAGEPTGTHQERYDYNGVVGGEWAAVEVATDDNLDWCKTAKAAKAACQRHADRNA